MKRAAVITGASGSIGTAIARRLAHDIDSLLLVDLAEDLLSVAATAIERDTDVNVATLVLDLVAAGAPSKVRETLEERGWSLQTLVNNAGINRDARALRMTEEQFLDVIRLDLVAPARLAEELRSLMPAGATIVNISSRAALGNFGQTNYVTAKSGLLGLTRSLALQWAPDVRVNAVAPGLVDTPMTAGMPDHVLSALVSRVPLGRMAEPEEIAATVAFLSSSRSSYVTGQVLLACGGRSVAA
jgi:3-oxoacyl-[acyl-carrier protein] reductase